MEESEQYYRSTERYSAGDYKLELTCPEGDVKVEYSTDSTEDKTWTALPADGRITLENDGYTYIFLKVTYTGMDVTRRYTLSQLTWTE